MSVKQNNLGDLYRELTSYQIAGNDYMVEKIQELIDREIRKQSQFNLNEIVEEEKRYMEEINE